MATVAEQALAQPYDEGELRAIRTTRISNPKLTLRCPRHEHQPLHVEWTRKVTLEDGIEFPTSTKVFCPICELSSLVDLLVPDPDTIL